MFLVKLQQLLPFTVLKRFCKFCQLKVYKLVATALTVYGIETSNGVPKSSNSLVATALTVYGIET